MKMRVSIAILTKMLGKQGWFWFAFAVVSSGVLAATDYGIAIFIDVLLKNLGLAPGEAHVADWLGRWNPTAGILIILLTMVGMLRGVAQFGVYQGTDLVHEVVNSRLRLLSAYEILKDPSGRFVSAAETNLKVGEIFPKTGMFLFYFVTVVTMLIQSAIYICAMVYTAWQESVIAIIGAAIIGLIVLKINRMVRRIASDIPEQQKGLVTGIQRAASNWMLVRAFRTSDQEHSALLRRNVSYFRHFIRAKTLGNLGAIAPIVLGVFLLITIIYTSMSYFQTSGLELIAFMYLFARFLTTAGRLAKGFGLLSSVSAHFRAASEFVDGFELPVIEKIAVPLREVSAIGLEGSRRGTAVENGRKNYLDKGCDEGPPDIRAENVTFSYSTDSRTILNNVSFAAGPGEQIGIIGLSGSGKSTLLGLISGILEPASGRITVEEISADQYFQTRPFSLGYVGSDPYLVEGSIKDNLEYGAASGYSDEQYRQVLESVHLQEFVIGLKDGLDFRIKENGDGLSAGQKQRLSLARSLLRKPKVLILDEVTSNLDNALEMEIAGVLRQLKGICTVVIVSHKPGILRFADRIYEMDGSGNLTPVEKEAVFA